MPKHQKYRAFTRPVEVSLVNGDVLTLDYCPARYSNGFNAETNLPNHDFIFHMCGGDLPKDEDSEKKRDKPAKLVKPVAGKWDWLGEDDKPIPITLEFLRDEVALLDQRSIIAAIMADLFPNDTSAETQTDESETSEKDGTDSSPTP